MLLVENFGRRPECGRARRHATAAGFGRSTPAVIASLDCDQRLARKRYDENVRKNSKTVLDRRKAGPLPCAAFASAYRHRMKIKAYLKPHCGWSNGVRAIMRKYSLPFEDIDIINNRVNYAEMVQKSGQPLSPCVEIDGVMLADVSGEEVENYLLSNDLVKPTELPAEAPTNAACSDDEHAKMATKTIRFF
ncbi:MAG: glutaredoxin [Opitutaceae bacterium]|nr:glutaredoxin [Opitutaceae bacterium]